MKTASDIMTSEVVALAPETPIREAAEILASRRFGSLPVIDAGGRVQGIVTEEDLISRVADIHLPHHIAFLGGIIYLENPRRFEEEAEKVLALTVKDIMHAPPPTVYLDTPVDEIATQMLGEDLRRLLVQDEKGRLLGIITRADIVRMLATGEELPGE